MSLLEGLLAADGWSAPGVEPGGANANSEGPTPFGIGLGSGGGELANLFQFDKTAVMNKNLEADRNSGVVPDISSPKKYGHNMSTKVKKEGQLCLPSSTGILKPALRMPRENKWISDWVFKLPVLAGSTPVSPEMFGFAMVGEFDETLIDTFGVADPSVPKGSKVKHVKTMNVPVSSIGSVTIGYSFCQMTEKGCPLAAIQKENSIPLPDEDEVFFGRFAFDSKARELLIVCPCSDALITQMVWAKQAPVACGIDGLRKRFRAMIAVPYSAEYGWSNLPSKVVLSNVYEEFRDPTYIPSIDFAASVTQSDDERAVSPFSSSSSLSSSPDTDVTTVASDVVSMSMAMETDNAFNLTAMTRAISDIEQLFKGQFSSPITLTDVYDPMSGRLVMRKTENLLTRMDRISSPEADVKFRTTVAQAYYGKYYSPVFDLPLLPGAQDSLSSTSSVTSKEASPSPNPDSSLESVDLSPLSLRVPLRSSVPIPSALSLRPSSSPPGHVPTESSAQVKIPGPTKRIRKAVRLAPRPIPVDEGSSGSNDDDSPAAKEEKARKAKEAKAYAKKIRNRESAARSNARRRKHIEAVKKELAELSSEKETLGLKKKKLMEENAKMKASLVEMYESELKK